MNKEQPWLDPDSGKHKTMYPLSWGKRNSYALFSPGIDRFFLVDSYDPYIMLETSRVLSSKISNIVYILDKDTPEMDNSNCLLFTTKHKMDEKFHGGPTASSHKQSSFMIKIRPDIMISTSWPIDFVDPMRKQALINLQEYALFALRVVHSITAAMALRNSFPDRYYMDAYFKDQCPQDFVVRSDTTSSPNGIEHEIKKILYYSSSVEDAIESIHNTWREFSQEDVFGSRQLFYDFLGIKQPDDLEKLGQPGVFNKEKHSQTMWVV